MTISPATASTTVGANLDLSATPVPAEVVKWSLPVGEAASATVTPNDLRAQFRASTVGTYHVTVAGVRSGASATATVSVSEAALPSMSVSPTSATIAAGGNVTISATVLNESNAAVNWTLTESSAGTLATNGNSATFTASNAQGTAHVVAKSAADPNLLATCTVTIAQCTSPTNCPAPAHASASCAAGACGIASCDPGFKDCDGNAADGCEINITNNAANCGRCGLACPPTNNGTAGCANS